MKTIAIQAEPREARGKGAARATRRGERLPGVLYGQDQHIVLSLDRKEFAQAMHEAADENVIFDVTLPGHEPLKSIARDVQHHPVTHDVLHVDFQHIDMTKTINVEVAVHLQGEPEGVKNFGGILEHLTRTLEVECLPVDIPSSIQVDVSELMIGDSIHVSDLTADRFEFVDDPTRVVAQVAAPTVEKTAAEEEAEAAEGEEGAEGAEGEEGAESSGDDAGKKEDGEG
jgi:large subunit ribosomal protein L25